MKKRVLFYLLLVSSFLGSSQSVQIIKQGNLFGISLRNENADEIKRIEPAYEELYIYTKTSFGGMSLGEMYFSSKLWNDTEFVETPIDPNDLSRTKIDTFITDARAHIPGKLIIAKRAGKWGLINFNGEEVSAFDKDEIYPMRSKAIVGLKAADAPYLVSIKNGAIQIINQGGDTLADDKTLPSYFKNRSKDVLLDGLEISYFGDYLLVNQGGTLFDTIIKVPAVKKTVNGKTKTITAAYQYVQFCYRGGNFNVWQYSTQSYLFPTWQKNIDIILQDVAGNNFFEALDVRNYNSIFKFQTNNQMALVPGKILFQPRN